MDKQKNTSRSEKVVNGILDTVGDDIQKIGEDATHAVIMYVKDWIINKYKKIQSSSAEEQKVKLDNLEKYIAKSEEIVDIGMVRKEIAVMWAMRKLGYSEEQTKQVLDLANRAYHEV